MTVRALFQIIIKIFGIFCFYSILVSIPQIISEIWFSFLQPNGINFGEMWPYIIGILFVICFYIYIVYILLFKSDIVVDKLKLDQNFKDNFIQLNIHKSFVLRIAIVVIAGIILIQELPNLIVDIFNYFKLKSINYNNNEFNYTATIISVCKIIIAFLIVGERNFVIKLMLKEDKNNSSINSDKELTS